MVLLHVYKIIEFNGLLYHLLKHPNNLASFYFNRLFISYSIGWVDSFD